MPDKPHPPWNGPPPWPGTSGFSGPPRDPDRIPITVEALHRAWETQVDQRLGQLVVNALRRAGIDLTPTPLFNIEDHVMLAALEGLADR